jgi:hypothetical protein
LQIFVVLKSQIEERILERTKVKAEKIEEDHTRHSNGGVRRAATTTFFG